MAVHRQSPEPFLPRPLLLTVQFVFILDAFSRKSNNFFGHFAKRNDSPQEPAFDILSRIMDTTVSFSLRYKLLLYSITLILVPVLLIGSFAYLESVSSGPGRECSEQPELILGEAFLLQPRKMMVFGCAQTVLGTVEAVAPLLQFLTSCV